MSVRDKVAGIVGRTRTARLVTGATVLAIAIAIAAFVALDSDDSDSDSEYVGEADLICVEGKQALATAGTRTIERPEGPSFSAYAVAAAKVTSDTRARLAALDPPADLEERAAALDAALGGLRAPLRQLERADPEDEPQEFQAAITAVEAASRRSDQAVAGLGLATCARIAVGLREVRER